MAQGTEPGANVPASPDNSDAGKSDAGKSDAARSGWYARLVAQAGGRHQLLVVALLSATLGLAAGYQTIVGAVAPELKADLRIDNAQIGLLITAASLLGAATTLPFGVLADRTPRIRLLAVCLASWSASVLLAGLAPSFTVLLIAQLALGAGIGAATPVVASLIGDIFGSSDRGRIYGLILTGEFIGAAVALVVAGQVAAWFTWRASFLVLVVLGPLVAWGLLRLVPEPARRQDTPTAKVQGVEHDSALTSLVARSGTQPYADQVLRQDPTPWPLWTAIKYVLTIRTNVLMIIASALVYYYVAGLQAFIVVFLRGRYDLGQGAATFLLTFVGVVVVIGTLIAGPLSDRLVAAGKIWARPVVGGLACLFAVAFAAPGLLIPVFFIGFPIILIGGIGMGAVNPPLDAGRLDIMHSRLWGRAESVRTFLQTLLKSSAPLVFGWLSVALSPVGADPNREQGGGAQGLTNALILGLVPLVVAGLLLLVVARRTYPRDVATALASEAATR